MPTFCRIEGWTRKGWQTMHAGWNLIDPLKYVTKASKRGRPIRAVAVDTGEVFAPEGWDLI